MKRIVTIQDISCIGKCSLTVALPIISAMGVETAVIPTAVLSTHTMFSDVTFADLTDQIAPITRHWQKERFTFDAIYTGYLGSFEQIDLASKVIRDFKQENTLVFVDPVMADNGKLYAGFDQDFAMEMKKLCSQADIIVPNITEASLMTGIPYREIQEESYLLELLQALAKLGPRYAILTGVSPIPGRIGIMGIETTTGTIFRYDTPKQPVSYHGTGDIFSSTFVGAVMNHKTILEALTIACDYTARTIQVTVEDPHSRNYGVNFETTLPELMKWLEK